MSTIKAKDKAKKQSGPGKESMNTLSASNASNINTFTTRFVAGDAGRLGTQRHSSVQPNKE